MKLGVKIIVLNILLFSGLQRVYAQQVNADSLYHIWLDKNAAGEKRLHAFYSRFNTTASITPEEFAKWGEGVDEAIQIAETIEAAKYVGFFNLFKGGILTIYNQDIELGCSCFYKGLQLAEKNQDFFMILVAIPYIYEANCSELPRKKLIDVLERIKPQIDPHKTFFHLAYAKLLKNEYHDGYCKHLALAVENAVEKKVYNYAILAMGERITSGCLAYSTDKMDELLISIGGNAGKHEEALKILRQLYGELSYRFYQNNQFPEALETAQKVIQYSEQLHVSDNLYNDALNNAGDIHNEIGNYKESEKYLLKALEVSRDIDNLNYIGGNYIGLSKLYLNKKEEDLAESYLDSAIHIMRDVKECEPCFRLARITRAGVNNLKQAYGVALSELNQMKSEYYGDLPRKDDNSRFYIELSRAYLGLKQYPNALSAANKGLSHSDIRLSTSSELNNLLYQIKEKTGDYNGALQNYKAYVKLQDSLAILRNSQEVTRLELENQFAQQRLADSLQVAQQKLETELAFQKQLNKQKTTRNLLLVLGLAALLMALGLWYRLKYIRKTQKIIKKEKEKAQASERAKHQFLANMSHEIRTPMNAIKGMTDILIRRNPKEDQKEYLDGIKQSSDSLLIIINDILDISKIEAGKIELEHEPFSINNLVNEVHTIMEFKAEEKGLELNKDIPDEELYVKGDATRLRQILINLIGNAIKFTEKGMVTTAIKCEQEGEMIQVHFTVSDTGIGIDRDKLEKIFVSFEQAYSDTSRKFEGTGLGLSISKKLVELHNGKIWIKSQKDKGSQFHFTIPYEIAATSVKEVKKIASDSNIGDQLKGIRILLVEDNQFNAVVAQEELEDAIKEIHLDVAENGTIAVERLKSNDYDVVLMDVQMPKMNGYEATKVIRAFENGKAHIPIIAMTANVLKEEVEACYQAGMNDFIGKPFDIEELLSKIFNLKFRNHG